MKRPIAADLPTFLIQIGQIGDVWLVGGSIDDPDPKDYDIFVGYPDWNKVISQVDLSEAQPNTFGGWKMTIYNIQIGSLHKGEHREGHTEIDIWPDDPMGHLMAGRRIYHIKSNTLFGEIG